MELFLIVMLILLLYVILKIAQLQKFSCYMDQAIDDFYGNDTLLWRTKTMNIPASYSKYSRSMPWNYNFASMVVYDNKVR